MPNFRSVDRKLKFITVDFEAQIVPGTFEHASSALVDQLDLSPFIETYRNDDTGAPAYHPTVLLKVILFGYSRGLISSRAIAAAFRQDGETIACSFATETLTATWQSSCLPGTPHYCRATPTECLPFFGKAVSSTIEKHRRRAPGQSGRRQRKGWAAPAPVIDHDLSSKDGADCRFGRMASADWAPGRSVRRPLRRGLGGSSVKTCARGKSPREPDAFIRQVVAAWWAMRGKAAA